MKTGWWIQCCWSHKEGSRTAAAAGDGYSAAAHSHSSKLKLLCETDGSQARVVHLILPLTDAATRSGAGDQEARGASLRVMSS